MNILDVQILTNRVMLGEELSNEKLNIKQNQI